MKYELSDGQVNLLLTLTENFVREIYVSIREKSLNEALKEIVDAAIIVDILSGQQKIYFHKKTDHYGTLAEFKESFETENIHKNSSLLELIGDLTLHSLRNKND